MTFPLENRLPYALMALLVLAVFYAIYFSKVLAQKRQGIQTRQIGRRKEKSVHTVELLMSAATLGAPVVQLLSIIFDWELPSRKCKVHRVLHRNAGRCRIPAFSPVYEGQLAGRYS